MSDVNSHLLRCFKMLVFLRQGQGRLGLSLERGLLFFSIERDDSITES